MCESHKRNENVMIRDKLMNIRGEDWSPFTPEGGNRRETFVKRCKLSLFDQFCAERQDEETISMYKTTSVNSLSISDLMYFSLVYSKS